MAPLHKINPLRLGYIRDAACRKFERNCAASTASGACACSTSAAAPACLSEPLSRLGAQVIGVDPSAEQHRRGEAACAGERHLRSTTAATTVEEMAARRERFDIVLAMEVVEHVVDVGVFLSAAPRC